MVLQLRHVETEAAWREPGSRQVRVMEIFGTNRKRVCDFLLVRNSNLWSYLAPFQRYSSFYVLQTPPPFHPNFGGVPVAPDRPRWVIVNRCLKLFGCEIIFEVFQPMGSRYLNATDGRTDRRTDRQKTCYLITALCVASRSKSQVL